MTTINETLLDATQALAYRGNDDGYIDPDTGLVVPGPIEGWLDEYTNFKYQMAMRQRAVMGGMVVRDGVATVSVYPLVYLDSAGIQRSISAVNAQALTLNATNYIYVTDGATTISVATSAPTDAWILLATLVVGSTDIDTNTDGTWKITDGRGAYVFTGRQTNNYPGEAQRFTAYNAEVTTLVAGELVYIGGWNTATGLWAVKRAQADCSTPPATHVVTESITAAETGLVTAAKVIGAQDTSGQAVGDLVYLSDTVAGGFVFVAPSTEGYYRQVVGVVKVVNATTGEIGFFIGPVATIPAGA